MTGCRTGYDAGDRIPVFRLPKDSYERLRWIRAIPRDNIPDKPDTVVCEKHWPEGYEKMLSYGRQRPKCPPSVFDCVAKSLIPTNEAKSRTTTKALSSQRNSEIDQLDEFLKKDKIANPYDVNVLVSLVNQHSFQVPVISFAAEEYAVIQSITFVCGVPLFMVKISKSFSFECYHCGLKCTIPSLVHNRISKMDKWSIIDEAINFLGKVEESHKSKILTQYRASIVAKQSVGRPVYTAEVITRAFEYFASSRSTYEKFRQDHQLPSVKTLTRITSKVKNCDISKFSC